MPQCRLWTQKVTILMFYLVFRVFYTKMFSPMAFPNYLHFFRQFYLIFRVFSTTKIAENESRDHEDMFHLKNADYPRRTYTLEEKERNMGLFQPPKLLLT